MFLNKCTQAGVVQWPWYCHNFNWRLRPTTFFFKGVATVQCSGAYLCLSYHSSPLIFISTRLSQTSYCVLKKMSTWVYLLYDGPHYSQHCTQSYDAYLSIFFSNHFFSSAHRFFCLNQSQWGPWWREKSYLVNSSGASSNVPPLENRREAGFHDFSTSGTFFSKTVNPTVMMHYIIFVENWKGFRLVWFKSLWS